MENEFSKCPHCGESDKEVKDATTYGLTHIVYFDCDACGKEFARVYEWKKNCPSDEV